MNPQESVKIDFYIVRNWVRAVISNYKEEVSAALCIIIWVSKKMWESTSFASRLKVKQKLLAHWSAQNR